MSYTHTVETNVVTRFNVGDVLLNQLGEERTVKKVFIGRDNILRYQWEEGTHGFVYIVDEAWELAPEKPTHTTIITIEQYGGLGVQNVSIPRAIKGALENATQWNAEEPTGWEVHIDWGQDNVDDDNFTVRR